MGVRRSRNVQKNTFDVYHKVIEFMTKNIREKLRVEDVAQYCTVSTSGLEKNFKRVAKAESCDVFWI